MSAGNAPSVEVGSEVPEVDTEHLGFKALSQGGAGPKKVKILPEPWPTNDVPPACASLLSIASKPGLLAAAGPNALVVTSAEKVRKAYDEKAGEGDVVSTFTPDVTLSVPRLRHVAFSVDGDFLVISAEGQGGLAVFDPTMVIKGKKEPEIQIDTERVAVRALLPNPTTDLSHFFAVVNESGKLIIANIADGTSNTISAEGVTCVAWSTKGKALVAGLQDGSLAIHMNNGDLRAVIPRPPEVDDGYITSGLSWLNNEEFLVVHSPKDPEAQGSDDSKYNVIKSTKGWGSVVFHPFSWDPLLTVPDVPSRAFPPRFSSMRLRNWQPALDDMLIMTNSHTDAIAVLASTSDKISPNQENTNELMLIAIEDSRKAAAPRTVYGEEGDSVFIGEALDLSSKEKLASPVAALAEEGINEAPWPLPAYMGLTHEGLLSAWWVLWDKSIKEGTRYPGLIFGSEDSTSRTDAASPQPATTPSARPTTAGNSMFGKSAATFGSPATPSAFGSPGGGLMKPTPPGFGTPAFGSTSGFGAASTAKPAFGQTSAFGQPSAAGFGATGGVGNKPSPWGTPSQASQPQANPFSAAAAGGSSGFAKFGQPSGGSTFSSFGSNAGAQSGFASLGQQKSPFGALKSEQSMGSTVTIGSGTGSTLPSWANTPAQGGSIFGQSKSSFNTASFESRSSETSGDDPQRGQRDDATPTPQLPPQQSKGLFGLGDGFKLGSTFKPDGTAKDDLPKPAASNGSFFGSGFGSELPTTPSKEAPQNVSTTPASPPKPKSLFPTTTPSKESATPKAPPPAAPKTPVDDAPLPPDFVTAKPAKTDDAPLPPDFLPTKSSKSADDDLPPLAGSPGVKVEAPSSEPEVSPLDDEDAEDEDSFSDEDDGDDEEDIEITEAQTPAAAKHQAPKSGGWTFQDSVNQSPQVFPPAPTPPTARTGANNQFDSGIPSDRNPVFGRAGNAISKQQIHSGSLFGQPSQQAPFSLSKNDKSTMPNQPIFPPPNNRAQDSLRSPSPVRSVPAAAPPARRAPLVPPGSSLSSSIQQPKPPTPQPEVSDLEDEEDERMRAQLAQPIQPGRTLDEFVAYQNYTGGAPSKTGHAAQIEMIYKDINGMVDALGWNARSIKSFTLYHSNPQSGHKIDRNTIDDVGDEGQDGSWFEKFTLCEIVALKALEDELEHELDAGRVQDLLGKLSQLARLLREKAKLMTRINDIRRQIINRKDPDKTEALRKAPLPKELADGQKALRNDYAQLLTSLHKAEDAASILRSRLVSHNAANGKTGAVPTMDAVKRTIVKLTTLAEKRNSDITMLESQMRKIGLEEPSRPSSSSSRIHGGATTPRRGRGGANSMRSSMTTDNAPFVTPPTIRTSKLSLTELNRRTRTPDVVDGSSSPSKGYGLDYASSSPFGAKAEGFSNELARLSDAVDENIEELRERTRRRRNVAMGLRKALVERGVRRVSVR